MANWKVVDKGTTGYKQLALQNEENKRKYEERQRSQRDGKKSRTMEKKTRRTTKKKGTRN